MRINKLFTGVLLGLSVLAATLFGGPEKPMSNVAPTHKVMLNGIEIPTPPTPRAGKQYLLTINSKYNPGFTQQFHQFQPADSATGKHPVIILEEGAGQVGSTTPDGNDIAHHCQAGASMLFQNPADGQYYTYIVLTPIKPTGGDGRWEPFRGKDMIDYAKSLPNVDSTRIYLTGFSLGGGGVWGFVMQDSGYWCNKIAAAVPIAGTADGDYTHYCANVGGSHLPVWAWHCEDDGTVGVGNTQFYQGKEFFFCPTNSPRMRLTYPMTGGHVGSWSRTYDTGHISFLVDSSSATGSGGGTTNANYTNNPNFYEWLLTKTRPAGVSPNPTVNAGSNQSITLPTSSVSLIGSATPVSPASSITTYAWTETSGPGTYSLSSPSSSTTTASSLVAGTYVFTLTATDNNGNVGTGATTIIVNPSNPYPAGLDSIQLLGTNCFIYIPTGTGPFPLVIELGNQNENASNNPSGLVGLNKSGSIKDIYAGKDIYANVSKKYIVFKPQPAGYNNLTQPDTWNPLWAALISRYGNIIDTSKYIDGTYKYIGMMGCERGADVIWNLMLYDFAHTGVGGSTPPTFMTKIRKIYTSGVSDVNNGHVASPSIWGAQGFRTYRFFERVGDAFTIGPKYKDSLTKYVSGALNRLTSIALSQSAVYDSMFSTAGLDSGHNAFKQIVDDAGIPPPTLVQLVPKRIFELSLYSDAEKGKSKFLFDSTGGSTAVDPMNGITTFNYPAGLRSGFPYKQYAIYYDPDNYPGRRGNRIIFDMTGAADPTDTTNRVIINSIWGNSQTSDAGDTTYFYGVDTMFRFPVDQRYKFLARPEVNCPLLGYIVTIGGNVIGWQFANINRKVRYIMLTQHLVQRAFGMTTYFTNAPYTKMVIYGNYDTIAYSHAPTNYALKRYPKKLNYLAFSGTNIGQGFQLKQLKYHGNVRAYGSTQYWDNLNTATLTQIRRDTFPDIGSKQYDSMRNAGIKFFWTIRDCNPYCSGRAPGGYAAMTDDFVQGVTEEEDWHNYGRRSKFFYVYAALHGAVNVPLSHTTLLDFNLGNGQNNVWGAQDGNEEDGHGVTPLSSFQRMNCDYDGYEGRLGADFGVKAADLNFRLIMTPPMTMDTNYVKLMAWFAGVLRTDKKVPFDVVDFHHYNRITDVLDHAPDLDEQVGSHGERVTADGGIGTMAKYNAGVDAIYNVLGGDTTKKIINSESGYGNWGTPAATPIEAGTYPWDAGCTPSITGRDSMTQKAFMMGQLEIRYLFSNIYFYNEFFFHNSGFGPNNQILFSSYGQTTGRNIFDFTATVFYPWWYYQVGMAKTLANYAPDSLLVDGGASGMSVYRLRNINFSDSVCIIRCLGSNNGSTQGSTALNFGTLFSQNVTEVIPSTTSETPTINNLTATSGVINRTVDEGLKMYFVKTVSGFNIPPVATITQTPDTLVILGGTGLTLNSNSSTDIDGSITGRLWSQLSGPSCSIVSPTGNTTTVTGMTVGVYVFQLIVTDNNGATSTATRRITMLPTGTTSFTQKGTLIYDNGGFLKIGYGIKAAKNAKGQLLGYFDYSTGNFINTNLYNSFTITTK